MKNFKIDRRHPKKINSIRGMVNDAVVTDPGHIAYEWLENGEIIKKTNMEFYSDAEAVGAAVYSMGYKTSHIACIGQNSYKWVLAFVSTMMGSGVFVPFDKELPFSQIKNLLCESDTSLVFCDKKWEKIFKENRKELEGTDFICFDAEEDGEGFYSFDKLLNKGKKLPKGEFEESVSDEYALKYLVYTSGTTGAAKGVMLSEHNICSGIYYGMHLSQMYDRGMSVLPMNHTYEAVCDILVAIHSHTTICINDSIRNIQKNMQIFKPDFIYLVPAFTEHFQKAIKNSIAKTGKEKSFEKLIKMSNNMRRVGIDMRKMFFSAIHEKFGGNLRKIICGGAPIRPDTGEFFDSIGITLTGGYGITECSPLVSVNDDSTNNFHSAGHRIPCLQWRIAEPDSNGIGEIQLKGDVVMMGYYKRQDLTDEAIVDGWFKTGDYGIITENDEITITGRKKNIIVLNNGKNVFPEELEEIIMGIPYVNEVVVSGEKNEYGQIFSLTAEIYTEEKAEYEQISRDVREILSEQPSYKRISKIVMRNEPFEKTTTNKIKRHAA